MIITNNQKAIPWLILVLMAGFFVFYVYGSVLISPNQYLFSTGGDGLKNYYTYLYHIEHDSSYVELEGMNYPYGENYLYTDCHPLLANSLKFLNQRYSSVGENAIGILNTILILSIFLTVVVVYALLRQYKFNEWIAIPIALCIALLSPQLFRIDGHFALSYSIAIPLSWLLYNHYKASGKLLVGCLLLLNNCIWLFTHAYLGMIVIAFLISLYAVNLILDKSQNFNALKKIVAGLLVITPVIIFYSYTLLVDQHEGRTNNPSGFFLYNAELDDILLPPFGPFRNLIDAITSISIHLEWEARGYIGFFNVLVLLVIFAVTISSVFKKNYGMVRDFLFKDKSLNYSLIAALVVLLFAMAFPFGIFPELLEAFPILKQFRATGRFVWPFYFVFTVYSGYLLQKVVMVNWKSQSSKLLMLSLIVIYVLFNAVEIYAYHQRIAPKLTRSANLFIKDKLTDDYAEVLRIVEPTKFQAIISIPFFYQGSESYSRPRLDEAVTSTLLLSYHLKLPTFCANLTRTSVDESKRIVQLVGPNYYEKLIEQDLDSNKPFLVVKSNVLPISEHENSLLSKGNIVFSGVDFDLYSLTYTSLFANSSKDVVEEYSFLSSSLSSNKGFQLKDSSACFYFHDFDNFISDTCISNQNALVIPKRGEHILVELDSQAIYKSATYHFGVWMYNGIPDALNLWFRLIVEEIDKNGQVVNSLTLFPDQAEVINDSWSMIEGEFYYSSPENRLLIKTIGKENSKAKVYIDDLLIREKGVDVYRLNEDSSMLFFNNHRILIN